MNHLYAILFILFSFSLVSAQTVNSIESTTSKDTLSSKDLSKNKREPVTIPKYLGSPIID